MNKIKSILRLAISIALTFTFSCSGGDDDNGGGGGDSSSNNKKCSDGGGSGSIGKGNDIASYRITTIGDQVWMAENLDYNVAGSRCYGEGGKVASDDEYDNNGNLIYITLSTAEIQANCDKYGRLYDWATAMALPSSCNSSSCASQVGAKHRGICPSGWHIPSEDEWTTLENYVREYGGTLKAESGWIAGNGTDDYDFSALPAGNMFDCSFHRLGKSTWWWSSKASVDRFDRCGRQQWFTSSTIDRSYCNRKNDLYSVRCVQD